jgi:hypothetical protein
MHRPESGGTSLTFREHNVLVKAGSQSQALIRLDPRVVVDCVEAKLVFGALGARGCFAYAALTSTLDITAFLVTMEPDVYDSQRLEPRIGV